MRRPHHEIVPVCLLAALAGCGGGSGGDAPAPTATITTENALAISSEVIRAAATSIQLAAAGGQWVDQGGAEAGTYACAEGGVFTILREGDPALWPRPGNTVTFRFTDCIGFPAAMTGEATLEVRSFNGQAGTGSFTLTADTVAFTFGDASGQVSLTTIAPDTAGISGEQLDIAAAGRSWRLTHLESRGTVEGFMVLPGLVVGVLRGTSSGTLQSSSIEGTVDYLALEPMLFLTESVRPQSLVIRGARGATITLLSASDGLMELHVDDTGDGVIDEVFTVHVDDLS